MPIEPPTDADRLRLATDLRRRVQLARRDGWVDYQSTWSTGEVLGVRAVLGDAAAEDQAAPLWAPTLWGVAEAEADAARDYERTRWWLCTVLPLDDSTPVVIDTEPVVPLGWEAIVDALRRDLAELDPELRVEQVKQKFGGLRVYVAAGDPAVAAAVRERITEAESASERTCEQCGRPGRLRTDRPWATTLCDEHAEVADGDEEADQ